MRRHLLSIAFAALTALSAGTVFGAIAVFNPTSIRIIEAVLHEPSGPALAVLMILVLVSLQ
jgi:hypothetical protein